MPKGQNAISWISKEASKLRQANPNLSQRQAIKKASANYRSQKQKKANPLTKAVDSLRGLLGLSPKSKSKKTKTSDGLWS
jgi:hypothetical protein